MECQVHKLMMRAVCRKFIKNDVEIEISKQTGERISTNRPRKMIRISETCETNSLSLARVGVLAHGVIQSVHFIFAFCGCCFDFLHSLKTGSLELQVLLKDSQAELQN